jgi:hypothetical protein
MAWVEVVELVFQYLPRRAEEKHEKANQNSQCPGHDSNRLPMQNKLPLMRFLLGISCCSGDNGFLAKRAKHSVLSCEVLLRPRDLFRPPSENSHGL